jgi:ABC-2 type transport system permease protein
VSSGTKAKSRPVTPATLPLIDSAELEGPVKVPLMPRFGDWLPVAGFCLLVALVGAGIGGGIGAWHIGEHGQGALVMGSILGGLLTTAALAVTVVALIYATDHPRATGGLLLGIAPACWGVVAGLSGGLVWAFATALVCAALLFWARHTAVPVQMGRELARFFYSPLVYVVTILFLLLTGLVSLGPVQVVSMAPTFESIAGFLLPLIAPLLTMHLLSEERARGQMEATLTAPISEAGLVLAKWLATLVVFACALIPTLIFVWFLFRVSDEGPNMGVVWSGYVGLLLQAGLFIAVGLLASAVTRSPLAAALGGILLAILLAATGSLEGLVESIELLKDIDSLMHVVEYVNLKSRTDAFWRGIVDSRDVVFLLSLSGFFLFLSAKAIELLKWR